MTDKENIRNIVELFIAWNGETEAIDIANLDSAINFIADSLQEESVSDDLEEASKEWLSPQLDKSYAAYGETKQMELTHFDGYAMLDAIEFGAQWQKQQDQETIELAEDHAMLAGMEKMKEQMMKDAVDIIPFDINPNSDTAYFWIEERYGKKLMIKSSWITSRGIEINKRVKLIIIKED